MGRIAGRFVRVEPRRRATALVLGLLADLPRKNCWTLAEHTGDAIPDGMQHLLHRAKWDADAVRDDVRTYVVEHLHDDDAVLVVDETGDLKKGTATVGVQRRYTGTAGRIENAQVAVYLVYSGAYGHAAIDRALYVPRSWTDEPDRCRAAGTPDHLAFATKPQLAAQMIVRALDAGAPARWVAGDEVYGDNPHLRATLEDRRIGYVLAVSSAHQVVTPAGKVPAKAPVARIPKRAWQRRSAGAGAKGERYYDWAQAGIHGPAGRPRHWWLLVRHNRQSGELAFHRCFSPHRFHCPCRCRCWCWCGWPGGAGRWRRRSRPARAWPAWTSTQSAAGPPGTDGSPSRCSPPTASSRSTVKIRSWQSERSQPQSSAVGVLGLPACRLVELLLTPALFIAVASFTGAGVARGVADAG